MTIQRALGFLLCGALALTLAGCRHSDALERLLWTEHEAEQIDFTWYDEQLRYKEELLSSFSQKDKPDAEAGDVDQAVEELALPTEEPVEDEPEESIVDPQYWQDAENEWGQDDAPVTVPDASLTQEDSGLAASEAPGQGGEAPGGVVGEDGVDYEGNYFAETYKQVVDAYGKTVEIPENVDRVAASGQAALFTLMLGGSDRLAATNADLSSGAFSSAGIFAGLDQTETVWESGGASLSDEGLERLLELKPDVVLEVSDKIEGKLSGNAPLSEEQVERLHEAGISYLALPAPTNVENLKTIATTIGTVLGDRSAEGGTNAPELAGQYVSWIDSAYKKVKWATAGAPSTLVYAVVGWDDQAVLEMRSYEDDGLIGPTFTGCAMVYYALGNTEYMAVGNFLSYAGVLEKEFFRSSQSRYVTQFDTSVGWSYQTPLDTFRYKIYRTTAAGTEEMGGGLSKGDTYKIGDGWNTILAGDKKTAEGLAGSEQWKYYGKNGFMNTLGFYDFNYEPIRSYIYGEYEIVVNPHGLCSWLNGSCESILESIWAAWQFSGTISEEDVRGYIKDFYSKFYQYSLSDAEVNSILEGVV